MSKIAFQGGSVQRQSGTVQEENDGSTSENDMKEYVDDVLSSIGFGPFQIVAFILAGFTCIAYVCESLTFAFISIEVTKLWNISSLVYASVPAATCISNIVGQVAVGYVADEYGRKGPYVISLFIAGTFIAASAFANSFAVFGLLRNLAAIGIGGTFVVKLPTLMEFLPVRYRGSVSISTGLIETFAQCAVAGLAWWLVPTYSKGWRYFILGSSIPSFVTASLFILFVESPRYLVTHGKTEKAWKVFALIARFNGKKIDSFIAKEEFFHRVASLTDTNHTSQSTHATSIATILLKLATIFKPPFLRRTVCFAFILAISNCVSFNTTLFLPNYLTALHFSPYFVMLVGIAAQLPGIALVAIIVEWPEFGRLNTLRIFTILSVIFLVLFAFIHDAVATPVIIVLVYFSLVPSYGLLMTYVSESYPTQIRVMTLSFMSTVVAVNGTWFPFVAGYVTDHSKLYPWLSPCYLAGVMLVQTFFTFLLNHETRGRKLTDIVNT